MCLINRYVRETRRMIGDQVFTQNSAADQLRMSPAERRRIVSVGVGDYTFDSHPAQRFACTSSSDPRCAGANPPWLQKGEVQSSIMCIECV